MAPIQAPKAPAWSRREPSSTAVVALHGLERGFAAYNIMTIVHAMTISGDVERVVANAQDSWAKVLARHPRMRATIETDRTARIHPTAPVSAVTVVRDTSAFDGWTALAQERTHASRDTTHGTNKGGLFSLIILLSPEAQGQARLLLSSDHTMSDGNAGLIILNDFLAFATATPSTPAATTTTSSAQQQLPPLPLLPSLRELHQKSKAPLRRAAVRAMLPYAQSVYKSELRAYTPLLPPNKSQQPLTASPPTRNPAQLLFADGSPAALAAAARRCREEGVTLHGAITALVVMAMHAGRARQQLLSNSSSSAQQKQELLSGTIRTRVDVDYNMRGRVDGLALGRDVGMYIGMATLDSLDGGGIDTQDSFWSAARAAKAETDGLLDAPVFDFGMSLVHHRLGTPSQHECMLGWLPGGVMSDVNISNVGRYPFPLKHACGGGDGTAGEGAAVSVDSVHVACNVPAIASSLVTWFAATDRMHYSALHKVEDSLGRDVFRLVVLGVEGIGAIGAGDTVAGVARQLFTESDADVSLL